MLSVNHVERTSTCLQIFPNFKLMQEGPGEVYGCDVTEIHGNQHIVVVIVFPAVYLKGNCQI